VNFGRFGHAWITDGLNARVFKAGNDTTTRRDVPVVWSDGTESPAFPVGCLTPPMPLDPQVSPLRMGLISGRHPALDETVGLYLVRNREVKLTATEAEQEALVYGAAREALDELLTAGGGVLELHQTGLQPAIVGFYRALTERLLNGARGKAWVTPRCFVPATRSFWSQEPVEPAIAGAVKHHSKHLALYQTGKENGMTQKKQQLLRWLPERAMTEEERDILSECFGPSAQFVTDLFERSQPRKLSLWG